MIPLSLFLDVNRNLRVRLLSDLSKREAELFQTSELHHKIQACYRFLPESIAYYHEYFGKGYQDFSRVVFDGEKPVIAFYAFCKNGRFLFFEEPVRFYDIGNPYGAYKILIAEIRKLSFEVFEFYDNAFLLGEFYHELDFSSVDYTAEIDLKRSYEEIKSDIRRSMKPQVNWGEKNLVLKILHAECHTSEEFFSYQKFHREVSGRQTRSHLSWELQYELLKNNKAYLVLGYLEGRLVSGSLVLHGLKKATYGVGVYDRRLMEEKKPLGAFLIMQAMKHAQSISLDTFEVGSVNFKEGDDKANHIAQFKKGFSPYLVSQVKHKILLKDSRTQTTREFYQKAVEDPQANLSTSVGRRACDLGKGGLIWNDIKSKLDLRKNSRLLDIGCGYGEVTKYLISDCKALNISTVLVDFPEISDKIKQLVLGAVKTTVYAGIFPYQMSKDFWKESLFDFVIMYSLIHCTDQPKLFVKRAVELLKPGGKLLIGDIANVNKKGRFLVSDFGREFDANYKGVSVKELPVYKTHFEFVSQCEGHNKNIGDDFVVETFKKYRSLGFDVFVLPQSPSLPFGHTREDMLIVKT